MTTSRQFAEELETPASDSPTSERVKDDYLEVLEETKPFAQTTASGFSKELSSKSECFYKPEKTEEFGLYTSENSREKFGLPLTETSHGFGAILPGISMDKGEDYRVYTADVSQEKYGGFPKYTLEEIEMKSKQMEKGKEKSVVSSKEECSEFGLTSTEKHGDSKEVSQENAEPFYPELSKSKVEEVAEVSKEKEAASAALFGITSSPRPETEGKHYFEETDSSEEEEEDEDAYIREMIDPQI